ncbi:multidrug efflux ABC transporter LmrA [Corallococcus caeni]|uniref:ABC transporter ATP-binding protein n=1 Tax=Corallococcus caeni TaxID=3082388 RepID=UPI0029580465|nr:multidrug efflux ABC transporter LmrA [Corallococcus sp. KH5-1]
MASRRDVVGRLLDFLGPARREFLLGICGMGLINLGLNLGLAFIMAHFTRAILDGDRPRLLAAVLGFALVTATAAVAIQQSAVALTRSAVRADGHLRAALFRKLVHVPLPELEGRGSGELLSRLNSDATQTAMLYRQSLQGLCITLLNGVGSTVAMLFIDWRAGLLVIGLSALMPLLMLPLRKPLGDWSRAVQESQSGFLAAAGQLVQGAAVIRYFNLSKWILDRVEAHNQRLERAGIRLACLESTRGLIEGLDLAVSTSLIVYGAWRGLHEPDFVPRLLALVQVSHGTVTLFAGLASVWADFQVRLASAERLTTLLSLPDESRAPGRHQGLPVPGQGLTVRGLGFAYGNASDIALHDVSFHVAPGQRVAFVGLSGAGKSTLFKLLLGLYPSATGDVWLDGCGIHEEGLDAWRRCFAYVPQGASLFSGTVYDNILGGLPDPGPEAVEQAARAANAHEFIQVLPAGYRTALEEGARNLSGGQRQRIAIARSFLQAPRVLLLDEPTSALDGENERHVQEALDRLMAGRITLLITHRLSACRDADQIFYVEAGALQEHGRHEDLMRLPGGRYRRLVDAGPQPLRRAG